MKLKEIAEKVGFGDEFTMSKIVPKRSEEYLRRSFGRIRKNKYYGKVGRALGFYLMSENDMLYDADCHSRFFVSVI